MANNKFDLKGIEKLINNRKQEVHDKNIALGESTGVAVAADNELHELVNAINTRNANNPVVNKMKLVEHRAKNISVSGGVAQNKNVPLDENTIKHITTQKPQTKKLPLIHESVGGGMQNDLASKERDNLAFNNFNKGTVTSSGSMYDVQKMYNQSGVVNEYNGSPNTQQSMVGGVGINPQIINEQIANQTVGFINEHFVKLADTALKNHIVETYAVERVKKVLVEQMKPLIKEMVVEAIREIQNKNKRKTAK